MKAIGWWRGQSRRRRALIGGGALALLAVFLLSRGASAVVRVARAQIGLREIPLGSNTGPEIVKFTGGRDENWCAHFVAFVFRTAGHPLPGDVPPSPSRGNPLSSVSTLMNVAKQLGRFLPAGIVPKPGDVIFYDHHTGIVTGVRDGKVVTVEGNFSNAVVETAKSIGSSLIRGYGRFV